VTKFNKKAYINQFTEQVKLCVQFASKSFNTYLSFDIRTDIKCFIGGEGLYEEALSQGSIKFLGGRILKPEQLQNVSVYDAARYTYVDGKIPVWINLYFEGYDKQYSYIRVVTSTTLTKKESELYDMPEGTKQFHILIPSIDTKE